MHIHGVRIYYEDTDHSGAVYHANYLRYMERAREHLLDPDALRTLWDDHGIGFVVYKATLTFREAAQFADLLEVRTTTHRGSDWRAVFRQNIFRKDGATPLVEGVVELVCVDREGKLVPLPVEVREGIDREMAARA